jgi:hypothetical protein
VNAFLAAAPLCCRRFGDCHEVRAAVVSDHGQQVNILAFMDAACMDAASFAAAGLEIATILAPQWFLIMGSCANMIKGLSWMAGGSTRSVFNLSFVRDNNIAGAS